MTQQKIQKLYCYIDETGQDTKGELFIVSVILIDQDKQKIEDQLIDCEKQSKKGKTKWQKAKFYQREAYINQIFTIKKLKDHLYYSEFKNSTAYYELVVYTAAQVIYSQI